jgi:hypothetical protein
MKGVFSPLLRGSGFSPERKDNRHFLSYVSIVRAKNVPLFAPPVLDGRRLKRARLFFERINASTAKCVFSHAPMQVLLISMKKKNFSFAISAVGSLPVLKPARKGRFL